MQWQAQAILLAQLDVGWRVKETRRAYSRPSKGVGARLESQSPSQWWGVIAVICSAVIHTLPLSATVTLSTAKKLGRAGRSFRIGLLFERLETGLACPSESPKTIW